MKSYRLKKNILRLGKKRMPRQAMSEEERRERNKQIDAAYYEKNKQKIRERYYAKRNINRVERILSTLTEQEREILAASLATSQN